MFLEEVEKVFYKAGTVSLVVWAGNESTPPGLRKGMGFLWPSLVKFVCLNISASQILLSGNSLA